MDLVMLPSSSSSSWVSLAAPAESLGSWSREAALCRAFPWLPAPGGCSGRMWDPRGPGLPSAPPSPAGGVPSPQPSAGGSPGPGRSPPSSPGARAAGTVPGSAETQGGRSGLRVPGASEGCGRRRRRGGVPAGGDLGPRCRGVPAAPQGRAHAQINSMK